MEQFNGQPASYWYSYIFLPILMKHIMGRNWHGLMRGNWNVQNFTNISRASPEIQQNYTNTIQISFKSTTRSREILWCFLPCLMCVDLPHFISQRHMVQAVWLNKRSPMARHYILNSMHISLHNTASNIYIYISRHRLNKVSWRFRAWWAVRLSPGTY